MNRAVARIAIRSFEFQENGMSTTTLLIIMLVILVLGGGFYGRGRWF